MTATRPWCALVCWPGLRPMLIGTAWTSRSEGEEAARVAMGELLRATFPSEPEILEMRTGQVVFVGDDGP